MDAVVKGTAEKSVAGVSLRVVDASAVNQLVIKHDVGHCCAFVQEVQRREAGSRLAVAVNVAPPY